MAFVTKSQLLECLLLWSRPIGVVDILTIIVNYTRGQALASFDPDSRLLTTLDDYDNDIGVWETLREPIVRCRSYQIDSGDINNFALGRVIGLGPLMITNVPIRNKSKNFVFKIKNENVGQPVDSDGQTPITLDGSVIESAHISRSYNQVSFVMMPNSMGRVNHMIKATCEAIFTTNPDETNPRWHRKLKYPEPLGSAILCVDKESKIVYLFTLPILGETEIKKAPVCVRRFDYVSYEMSPPEIWLDCNRDRLKAVLWVPEWSGFILYFNDWSYPGIFFYSSTQKTVIDITKLCTTEKIIRHMQLIKFNTWLVIKYDDMIGVYGLDLSRYSVSDLTDGITSYKSWRRYWTNIGIPADNTLFVIDT